MTHYLQNQLPPARTDAILRVAVGSTNPVKVAAAQSVIGKAYPEAVVQAVDVPSRVSSQPMSDEETIAGAINRAQAARLALDADLGVGLEGGVQPSAWGWLLCSWVAVVDRYGRLGLGSAGRIQLPPALIGAVQNGQELGLAMDGLAGMTDSRRGPGAVGILTNELVKRADAFMIGTAYALARFLHPEWYPD
jgi:inosine/xanthosine triphosphatase